jgi:transcriptional regulator with XRE-family HTH domain
VIGNVQDRGMAAVDRAIARGTRIAERQVREVGEEFRERRVSLSLSQARAAEAAKMSRTRYGLIERGLSTQLTVHELNRIAAALGLAPSLRLYPGGVPLRDAAHARRLSTFLSQVREPLRYRIEVPLPLVEGRHERRAWDAIIYRGRERCAAELEMRLRDVQAALRRIDLKRRDDPTESFLLLVADTRLNRRALAEFEALFVDLPRLRGSRVRSALDAGELPPAGLLLL